MNILDKIINHKKAEVESRRQLCPVAELEKTMYFNRTPLSLKQFLKDPERTGIIAEFKKKSPSKGVINDKVLVQDVVNMYDEGGASAISVLTDIDYFGGSDKDLTQARVTVNCPLLRKDFIVDQYQIVEAKSLGADIILLIAAALTPQKLQELAAFTKYLGMEVLLEVHDEEELKSHINDSVDVVGVNNRNLKTFEVSIETSKRLSELIPEQFLKVSESGIDNPETIRELKKYGFNGFLIGENFMKTENPGKSFKDFVSKI
ncbi:indole-3-glycerol phosphate synthase TrpC [Cytophagaceae bacterium ABcell3]|nr:indole-3-glycerol phosphate synthase TrpC [Cytophagaceae bacterium ABcell3]